MCGKLGHTLKACEDVDPDTPASRLQYGAWLRGSALKTRRCYAELELHEERKLFAAFRNNKSHCKVKQRLTYTDQQHTGLDGSSSSSGKSGHEAKMAMDELEVAVIGNEFLKWKIDHVLEPKGGEKLKAVESLVVDNPPFDTRVFVDSRGRSGGLGMLRKRGRSVDFLSSLINHIDVKLKWRADGPEWRSTGKDFTWWNGQSGCDSIEERLDRYCATSDWSALFPEVKVSHIDDDMSDHLLIVLHCFEEKRVRRNRRRKWFENMWSFDSSYEDIIRGAWAG
ncbi:hypothetical protein Cgig2_005063 [Carnegiea gigantea]|uniref:Reverse transcriptase n=1 Tax=Carnegiea gigantea TaxID=171969 RepID=A0A9Q1QSC7_9CARY|nr:hypothetical protein Cgig2_005063 [Carnegiea gigantea]